MGKILVKGKAERQYEADTCVIDLTIDMRKQMI